MKAGLAIPLVLAAVAAAAEPSPYAGREQRAIKALPASEIDDLLAGRGAGMALPAELNGYPGPTHVLALADELGLSPQQTAETRRLFDQMRAEARPLGEAVVAREAELEALFASGRAESARVRSLSAAIGRLRGELRYTHLGYHLAMRDLLSAEQVVTYDRARGYGGGGHGGRGDPER